MSRIVGIVAVLIIFLVIGVLVPAIFNAEEEFRRCQNHLRQIGSFGVFHSGLPTEPVPAKANSYFPSGTVFNPKLTVEERMSWYVLVLGTVEQAPSEGGNPQKKASALLESLQGIDPQKPWTDEVHETLARTQVNVLLCPSVFPAVPPEHATLSNYVGNGGIGADTPGMTLEQAGPKAGVFRYDSRTPVEVIQNGDGLSNSISIMETNRKLGPWLQGGRSTIRCLESDTPPFLGINAPFAGCHRGKGNFAFADGSVQVKSTTTDPAVFRALLTIQGRETEFDLGP